MKNARIAHTAATNLMLHHVPSSGEGFVSLMLLIHDRRGAHNVDARASVAFALVFAPQVA